MAVYGNINKTTVCFKKPGVYKITCHEYCGVGHQLMQAEVIVNTPATKK
jgi:cytochrome c oxidase subunit 2